MADKEKAGGKEGSSSNVQALGPGIHISLTPEQATLFWTEVIYPAREKMQNGPELLSGLYQQFVSVFQSQRIGAHDQEEATTGSRSSS